MKRRWFVLIAVVLAVLVIASVVLVIAGPVAAPGASASEPPASPTASADTAIAFVDAGSPEEAAWYRIGGDPGQFPPHLQVGTMANGVTFDVELPFDPGADPQAIVPLRPVLGVGDGVVVIVADTGGRSTLSAVAAATGDVHELLVSNDVIVNGLLSRDGRTAYYLTADRLTGDLTGAWRLAVGDGRAPDAIEALLAAAPAFRLAAITRFFTRMLLSPDGTTLGLFRCVELDCVLRAVRTDDGSLVGEVRIPRGGGDPFGITGQVALLRPLVPDGPFRIGEVVDLASGQTAPIPFDWPFGTAAVVEGPDGAVLALQTAGSTGPPATTDQPVPPEVTLIGVADMLVEAEYAPPLSSLGIIGLDDHSIGADLPPGWILVYGTEAGELETSVYALNMADGSLLRLPAVGASIVQG